MSVLFSNNAATTLAAGVGDSATSISVADGSVFPTLSGSDYFYLTLEVESNPDEKEIVKCTARSGNTLTISRAQDGTSARSFSTADKAQLRLTAAGLNDVATQADTDTTYTVGDGGLTQNNFTDTLKSKLDGIESSADVTDTANVVAALTAGTNVAIAADGTVSSTDTNTTYSVGDGGLTQKNFTSTLKTKLDGIEASANNYSHPSAHSISFITGLQTALDGKVDDSQVLTNVPENAVFTDTTYSVGDGGLTQNNFTNSRKTKLEGIEASADVTDTANVVAALTAGTNVAIAADGTISSTDTNTTYSVGDGGLTQKNFTTTLKTKLDGIEASADVTDTTNVVAALTAGTNVSIGSDGTISSTDTNTTYSVGDGGLTQKNFTTTLKTKLDGIAANANNYSHPSAHSISFITGLQTALDGKVDDSQVLTDVPANAVFTDTNTTYSVGDGGLTQKNFTTTLKNKLDGIAASANNYSLPFTDNSTNWNTAYGWGNHASEGYYSSSNPPPTYSKYLRSDTSDTMSGTLSLEGNLLLTGSATTSNQSRMIDFTGFDKEGTTDTTDRAYIAHTTNTGGHSGSALVISSQNDANDGIAFETSSSSQLKHNSKNIGTQSVVTTAPKSASGFPNGHVWYVVG